LRVAIYEMLQESQRARPGISVLVPPDWPMASILDLADLVRARVSVVGPNPALQTAMSAASIAGQVTLIDADAAAARDWDMALTSTTDPRGEPWRCRAKRVVFADFGGC
jgi:hypothetical protein